MKILGIDSSGLVASVAAVEDDRLLGEYTTDYKKTHSQTLLPMLDELRKMIELDLNSLDAIAVASGPGSFTGLRIGAATAKGLGLALEKPLVEVPTLEGLAWNLWGAEGLVCPLMDARRNQVYAAVYEFIPQGEGFELRSVVGQAPWEISVLLEEINQLGRSVILLGDGVPVYLAEIREKVQVPWRLAPAGCNRQRAACVASLGAVYYGQGRAIDADLHQPEYLRKSQAERERDAELTAAPACAGNGAEMRKV
ncbi:MAG: tRNA (adenosine(37)-N6)-threonylcarbamoyltransferase complex dimerization subunit type 1 TsaB [Roseburia sp.]|nr:tRNA (adenosine(37)-N6)-threonylcarbamoyltransferase complex dimerization subunit type 1 TsaB [Roseburia sp.]MCM1099630.1 tRNA (adenosine(37)-N6)-threonylcarbamoyltransferase complex dimerization subunit type 1 TsaB [Ruminococcus flavefaciens]